MKIEFNTTAYERFSCWKTQALHEHNGKMLILEYYSRGRPQRSHIEAYSEDACVKFTETIERLRREEIAKAQEEMARSGEF